MYKQAPSRSHRSKGIKVKHVLQICLLVAVCFWLIYQVKRSHEKRREFDAKDEKIVDKVQSDGDVLKFGRKDLPRSAEIATGGEKQGEDEEEKEAEEEENISEEEEVKHEDDESERDDGRTGEREVEREGGDAEIDENETEKSDSDRVNEEELVDEDKEKDENKAAAEEKKEEKEDPGKEEHSEGEEDEVAEKEDNSKTEDNEDVDKEDQSERDTASDEQDHDGDSTDTHEAREELYKADDASSEVAHNVQTIIPETENATMGHANEMFGKVSSGLDNGTKISSDPDTLVKKEVQLTGKIGDGISNVTVPEQKKYKADLTKLEDGSPDNTTSVHSHQLEVSSNSTSLDGNLSKNSSVQGTIANVDQSMVGNILGKNNKSELAAVGNEKYESATNLSKTESVEQNATESLSSNNSTLAVIQKTNDTNIVEAVKDSSVGNDIHVEKSENSESAGSDETSTSQSYDDNSGAIQKDPIDASDTTITEEEEDTRTDLDTLPEIRTEIQNSEEAMAE